MGAEHIDMLTSTSGENKFKSRKSLLYTPDIFEGLIEMTTLSVRVRKIHFCDLLVLNLISVTFLQRIVIVPVLFVLIDSLIHAFTFLLKQLLSIKFVS